MINGLLIGLLSAVSLGLIATGLRQRGGIYRFPFLAGATFLGFIVPQLPGLATDRFLPSGSFERTLWFTICCALMCGFGWRVGWKPLETVRALRFDERRVLWVALALSAVGAFFFQMLNYLPADVLANTQPTGLPVVFIFFGNALFYGFGLAVLCSTRRLTRFGLLIMAFDLVFLLYRVIITGKRGDTTEISLIILLSLWFRRDFVMPRAMALAAALLAGFALTSIADYRGLVHGDKETTLSDFTNIDVLANFQALLSQGGDEMHNAVVLMDAVNKTSSFDFGLFHWNTLVFNFVPAQLLGNDVKDSLMIPVTGQRDRDFSPASVGSTETGMTDAFASFWYFGVIKFFLVAYLMRRLYETAVDGSFLAQILYMLSITPSMHVITHHTQWLLSAWVTISLLMLPPLLLLALQPKTPALRPAREAVSTGAGANTVA